MAAMNVLPDPTKKPSINSLLNPQTAASYRHLSPTLQPSHGHPQSHPSVYGSNYPPQYGLRAASWDDSQRKPMNAHSAYHHPHHHPVPMDASELYSDPHASQALMRPRDDPSHYAAERSMWQSSPPTQQYGPTIANIFSDERSSLSNDYQPQASYASNYEEPSSSSSIAAQSWQNSERASARLVARGTAEPSRYNPYYESTNQYHSTIYSPPQQVPVQLSLQAHDELSGQPASSSTLAAKRPPPESEDRPGPKPKRAKSKPKSGGTATPVPATSAGTSKRGYSAKKRSEAALISAQNANAIQRARTDNSQGSEPRNETNSLTDATHAALVPELQFARCMSNRYRLETFPRCVSCTRRWAGDTCRFQGIRVLLRDSNKTLVGISFGERNQHVEPAPLDFPSKWNQTLNRTHIERIKLSIAKALLPTLKQEAVHLKVEEIVRRPREMEVRATCDTCMTSLFSTSWMCRLCGREVCAECFIQVRELTSSPADATEAELAALQGRREKQAHANPFFLSCTKRIEHGVREFTPVTRFTPEELLKAIQEMEQVLQRSSSAENECRSPPGRSGDLISSASCAPTQPTSTIIDNPTNETNATKSQQPELLHQSLIPQPPIYDSFTPSNAPEYITSIPIYRPQIIPAPVFDLPDASLSTFAPLWDEGLPMMVKGLLPRFKIKWNPNYFIQQYGDQPCLILECQTDTNKRTNVRDFFGGFGNYEGRTECWKLKDWPPTADFKTAFPELYEDFSQAVPVPDYVRRDGVYNIGSHFPTNTVGPDLGPKMYNSLASSQEPGSKGSTRLHMDMADALNVMLHAERCPDGTEGYAVWDLFRADDSEKLRGFLRKRSGSGSLSHANPGASTVNPLLKSHDPIHVQQYYLDVELRRALWEECGVKSYRIYQRPGDGVFIPAGCAHQVANMSDCIKIAIDFVSPENINRCEKLTKEFREQNQSKVWKDDVLQLRTMMWFAWQSCTLKEEELDRGEGVSCNGKEKESNEANHQPTM